MLKALLTYFMRHPSFHEVSESLTIDRNVSVYGLGGASWAFLATALLGGKDGIPERSVLAVLPEEEEADTFRGDVEEIAGNELVRYFPERDTSPYEPAESHFEVRSQRVETLDLLERGWHGIVVCTIAALHDPTTPPGLVSLVSFDVRKAQTLPFSDFIRALTARGFVRKNTVTSPGQIAVRGGIVDVYSYGGDIPYRVEFCGDEIESIRTFSTKTQRSVEEVDGFRIIPPDEFVTEAGINAEDERRIADIEQSAGIRLDRIRHAFEGEDRPNGMEQYLHVVFGAKASLCSYFGHNDAAFVIDPERCTDTASKRIQHAFTIWERQRHDDPDIPSPEYFYMPPGELMDSLKRLRLVNNYYLKPPGVKSINFNILSSRQYQGNLVELKNDILKARRDSMACHIACDNTGQAELLSELLEDIEGGYTINVAHISGGFTDPATGTMLLTDHEIFGRHRRRVRYRRYKEGVPIPDYRALVLGDYVVHVDYGIGRYMGLKRVKAVGAETDCLVVAYLGDDRLYVPVEQLKRLKKYSAEEGVVPVVTKLGGTSWEKLKARTKKSIERLACDLLRLYAERKAFPGHEFKPDESMLRSMEESFMYEETPDQACAWADIRRDMESPYPMDRLICGDVGFGKTEIAIRAAFLAVLDNKQVVLLVPTTILAEQHEQTFTERLAEFPVRITAISRFKSRARQKEILESLAYGGIDIVIGTHRLLSKDVYFKNLGILIIDEEQRFGVRSKERIKQLKRSVDVISLSATPIPRTLNMSLLGARDISFINTPPPDRLSVHTEVVPFEEKSIVEAVMREIDRGGQVFFVHNRVRSIDSMAAYLRSLMPNLTMCVVHGRLPERDLESRMHDFYHGRYQVLVTSMIIESGLDIPNVNTILINRADTFGLSQLYQLRGRVGRSNVRAYAYLLVPPKTVLSKIARNRLRTIEEFSELGSGLNIAMRDLELRGAGNILGTEQSGHIAAVGFDLYMELLHETIAGLRGEPIPRPPEVEILTRMDSYLPENYIRDPQERVLYYRRLSESISPDDVRAIEEELFDRFGRPEAPALNLLAGAYIRHYASRLGARTVTVNDHDASLFIPESEQISRERVEKMVRMSPVKLYFSFDNGMRLNFTIPDNKNSPLDGAKKVLQALAT